MKSQDSPAKVSVKVLAVAAVHSPKNVCPVAVWAVAQWPGPKDVPSPASVRVRVAVRVAVVFMYSLYRAG